MRLIVLDTNALIQALPTRSQYHRIWTDFLAGKYRLCVSNEILTECQNRKKLITFAHRLMNCLSYSWPIKETK